MAISVTALASISAVALAAPPARVVRTASGSVVATRVDDRSATGFAFRSTGSVITAAGGDRDTVTTAQGRLGQADGLDEQGGLALVAVPEDLLLAPLPISPRTRFSRGFVIGPPLGYARHKVRRVRLDTARAGAQPGHLPPAYVGAPVVTARGELIGAVSAVGRRSWSFTSAAELTRLEAKPKPESKHDGGGVPLWAILAAALVVLIAALGSIALVSRRRRAAATATLAPPQVSVRPRQAVPLVRRREPAPEVAVAAPADEGEGTEPEPDPDDFEILLKDREP
jgi:hypothetical protein